MFRFRILLITLLWSTHALGQAGHCGGQPNPQAPAEITQFDFLLGDHEVTLHAWTGESWSPARPVNAQWRGWYGLEGLAIYDEWTDPDPERGGNGINVRMYDPDEGLWKMMWISTRGKQIQNLRAEMREGVMTMWNVDRTGWKAEFEILSEDTWARADYQQDEAGHWIPQFRLVATRLKCS